MASSSPASSENNSDLTKGTGPLNAHQKSIVTEPNSKSELISEDSTTTFTTDSKDPRLTSHDSESATIRSSVGDAMNTVSDLINDNLIAARFGVMASVVLLGAYGISNTPLFFRFRTIHDVPSSYFVRRKRLYGRIVEVDTKSSLSSPDGSIHIYVRHLSPVGQILPKTWFDFFRRVNTTAVAATSTAASSNDVERKRDLLKVKIAGVQYPPFSHFRYKTEEYLERLARDRTLVSCQLLARQVPKVESSTNIEGGLPPLSKRSMEDAFPELKTELHKGAKERDQYYNSDSLSFVVDEDTMGEHLGVCKLAYRPTLFQFFPTDIAVSLLLSGNASVAPTLLASNQETADEDGDHASTVRPNTTIVDSSQRLDDLRNDVTYLERLVQAEFEALKNEAGIWAFSEARETKSDVVAEIEFQASAGTLQKLWRRLRGG
mmetsp:Transcript_42869/g.103687  ORF Transcript_42869/g.103687 Transcript_42869/m.103687 type:complete len:433 (-) Transcript_42869:754-2052(-)